MTTQEMLDAIEIELFGFILKPSKSADNWADEIDELVAQQEFADKAIRSRTFIQGNAL